MATCTEIISRALVMARVVARGDEATSTESADAMAALLSIYQRLADTALSTDTERYETDDYTAEEGERIYCTGTVTLPTTIDDGDERRPLDLAAIQYLDETTASAWRTYISDKGTWTRIDNLVEASDAPFADRNQDGLAALLATEIAHEYGKEPSAATVMQARRFQSQMQPRNTDPVEYY
jgi:hypothetical protein